MNAYIAELRVRMKQWQAFYNPILYKEENILELLFLLWSSHFTTCMAYFSLLHPKERLLVINNWVI